MHQYQLRLTRIAVYMEAIFTQLILQHALRIRVVAEAKSVSSPAARSIPGDNEGEGGSDSGGIATESTTMTTVSEATAILNAPESGLKDAGNGKAEATPTPNDQPTEKSLIGRMNNLISSDLQAIGKATEFLQIMIATPIIVFGTLAFLYAILGWSALAGFGAMLLMMPLPAFVTHRLQWMSREMAKKVCT